VPPKVTPSTAAPFVPDRTRLRALADAAQHCSAPFVGPAGALLDKALTAAGIPRKKVYVTNAVKHFKWEPRGKRRIHKKPRVSEVKACRPWLEAELRAVGPGARCDLACRRYRPARISAGTLQRFDLVSTISTTQNTIGEITMHPLRKLRVEGKPCAPLSAPARCPR